MQFIALLAVMGILFIQWSGLIPLASVGGSLVVALAYFAAALVVGIYDAWRMRRGVLGWIVSVVVSLAGAFVAAPIGGMLMAMILDSVANVNGSLAKTGGPLFSVALVGGMLATILGAWGALKFVDRWR